VSGLKDRIAIIERGMDGTIVYLIRVSYLPKCGVWNEVLMMNLLLPLLLSFLLFSFPSPTLIYINGLLR